MTENTYESYESIRDHSEVIPAPIRQKWQHADNHEQRLRQTYERLEEDGDLTAEAKSQRAIAAHTSEVPKIVAKKQDARDSLLAEARISERRAKPWPKGQPKVLSNSPDVLGLAYSESERLVRIGNKRAERPGPFGSNHTDFLREKYKEGLDTGGIQGAALCYGVERAAEELGVPLESIIAPLRTDEQRVALDDARRLEYFSGLISTKRVPEPPRSLTKAVQRQRREMNRPPAPVLVPGAQPITISETPHTGRKGKKKSA
jgi:hypothetical protein